MPMFAASKKRTRYAYHVSAFGKFPRKIVVPSNSFGALPIDMMNRKAIRITGSRFSIVRRSSFRLP